MKRGMISVAQSLPSPIPGSTIADALNSRAKPDCWNRRVHCRQIDYDSQKFV